jgi:hypothetical protein
MTTTLSLLSNANLVSLSLDTKFNSLKETVMKTDDYFTKYTEIPLTPSEKERWKTQYNKENAKNPYT